MTSLDLVLLLVIAALLVALGAAFLRRRPPKPLARPAGAPRILVPFFGRLDQTVVDAAIRIARAEGAVLVPAYLLIVPPRYAADSPPRDPVQVALPLLAAVEPDALRAGVPVDGRTGKGRNIPLVLALECERFDASSRPHRPTAAGASPKEPAWP